MSEAATREPHRLIAATVGVAIPRDKNTYGYLSEHHSFGESEDIAGDYAEELAAEMLATTLGLEFDPDKSWDEKKEVTGCRTRSSDAERDADRCGRQERPRTTVVAAAVLVG
jgi:arginine decarboxylase